MTKKIIIAGAGGIGRACGLILLQHLGKDVSLSLADINEDQCNQAESWIQEAYNQSVTLKKIVLPPNPATNWNPDGELLLDCTPGAFAADMASIALRQNMHYANLTENVPATKKIYQLVQNATTGFALQTGLAPGYINQLGRLMASQYSEEHPGHTIDSIKMRVGALSQYASSPGFYAFVWNPVGVSTEYLNQSEVIEQYRKVTKPSLSSREQIILKGIRYEADLTSGGAADLPEFYKNKVRQLNYKTLRYPGHFDYIDQMKRELGNDLSVDALLKKMRADIPMHDQDRVLIYCAVNGKDKTGSSYEIIRHGEIYPAQYGSVQVTAIQRATAASLAQTALLLLTNRYSGVLTQSRYPLQEFLNGDIIRKHYGSVI